MKKYTVLFSILALLLVSFACQTLTGGGGSAPPEQPSDDGGSTEPSTQPTLPPMIEPGQSGGGASGVETEFPIPDGAFNVMKIGGSLNFQIKMSLDEAMKFYVDTFTKSGYTERTILTVTSDTTFSMVFDGHASGKAIVIQGVDLGDGSVNINIRLEDT